MGGKASRPWHDLDNAEVFKVHDLDRKCSAAVAIAYPNFYFDTKGFSLRCSLADIRGYAQKGEVFSFETGRSCPGGSQRYFTRVKGKTNIHTAMARTVKQNMPQGAVAEQGATNSAWPTLNRRKHETRQPVGQVPEQDYEDPDAITRRAPQRLSNRSYNKLQRDGSGRSRTSDHTYNRLSNAPSEGENAYNHLHASSTSPQAVQENTYNHLHSLPQQENAYNHLSSSAVSQQSVQAVADPTYNRLSRQMSAGSVGSDYNHLHGQPGRPQSAVSEGSYARLNRDGMPSQASAYNTLGQRRDEEDEEYPAEDMYSNAQEAPSIDPVIGFQTNNGPAAGYEYGFGGEYDVMDAIGPAAQAIAEQDYMPMTSPRA
eukprot:TRINITY_DN6789_c0_g3_i1.p1 TRINITY_DN6789_c0_g3~~TRINITY_DN6789_c0_g3_i1.p1  ORF type:complete len:371 (+),score=70.41 TRINITY_DN6789_c0_g3_i1:177-1289(+)